MKFRITFFFLTVFSFYSFSQTGNIQGTIIDENGISVPGATVLIQQLNKGSVSDFDGKFTMVNMPEGNYTVLIKYLGYADTNQEVSITAGKTTDFRVKITSQSTELKEIELSGYGFSNQARALNTQKNKQNITNIV